MTPLSPAQPRGVRRPVAISPWMSTRLAVALIALSVVVLRPESVTDARAGQQAPAHEKPSAGGELNRALLPSWDQRLAGLDRRLTALAQPVLKDVAAAQKMREESVGQAIKTREAEASYLNAKLAREVAEIELGSYAEGTRPSELATTEGKIGIAKAEIENAQRKIAEAKERLTRISALADEQTPLGLNLVYIYTDQVERAELLEKQARAQLSILESEKDVLTRYTVVKRLLELKSEVKGAHSVELAKQANWELAKGREKELPGEIERSAFTESRRQILALIDQAIRIEDRIRAKLVEFDKPGPVTVEQNNEIARLIQELERIVGRAESLRDIDDFRRLKPRLQQAAQRYKVSSSNEGPTTSPTR